MSVEDERKRQYLKQKRNKELLAKSNKHDKLNRINRIREVKNNVDSHRSYNSNSSNDSSDEYQSKVIKSNVNSRELDSRKRYGSLNYNREVGNEYNTENCSYNQVQSAKQGMGLDWPAFPRRLPNERMRTRKDIKIIKDIQIIPPRNNERRIDMEKNRTQEKEEEMWRVVRGKRMRRSNRSITEEKEQEDNRKYGIKRRPSRSSAVTITGIREDFSYAEALYKAKNDPEIRKIGVNDTRIRKTAAGGILIEVNRRKGKEK